MDVLSACMIDTRIVYGFSGAGKTSYIRDCIRNDYFYKYGTTLILCFEQGRETYDEEALRERNTQVVYYEGRKDIEEFCLDPIRRLHPDRIYVEMNTKIAQLRQKFPDMMQVTSVVTLLDFSSLEFYFANSRQQITQMVSESQQVTFRGCPSKDLLAPYSQEFQLVNHRASYLRQDPMGYHEKAFDLFVPYSLEADTITITMKEYLVFWLDAAEHPEHYDGKRLCFTDPLELRRSPDDSAFSAGRVVMTCCMADLQFMSFELTGDRTQTLTGGWITMQARALAAKDAYGQKRLKLQPEEIEAAKAPQNSVIATGNRKLSGPDPALSVQMFQQIRNKKTP